VAEERRRRRRGRRRGGGDGHSSDRPAEERPEEDQTEGAEEGEPEGAEESEPEATEEGGSPSRPRFFFGRRRNREEEAEEKAERSHKEREERQAAGTPADTSPLSFWRRGRARTYREQPMPKQTMGRTLRRARGMRFPPWVPVLFVVFVVFGILGLLFVVRGATGAPRINDHRHATYQTFICGQRQGNFPEWGAGVHTHADGVIHIHPFLPSEEGAGARLGKWFEYGGGKLTQSEMRKPGSREEFKNGDECPDGSEGFLQVFVNGAQLDNWSRYIPEDGDRVRIVFGPEEEGAEALDRTVIAEEEAARTVSLTVSDGGNPRADTAFSPTSIEVDVGETVKVAVSVSGSTSHGVRVAGPDGEYETGDDFVSDPEIIASGDEGVVVIRFDEPGTFEFRDPLFSQATGSIVVTGAARTVELEVTGAEGDAAFGPDSIELKPGETVKLLVSNTGSISHSVRLAGADGEYNTADDFVSDPEIITPGEEGVLVVHFDEEGEFKFQDPTAPLAIGTIMVTEEPEGETPEPGDGEPVDVTFDVSMGDNFFEPSELEVKAGQTFRIKLTNDGEFIHNLRIAGADGEYDTEDDLVSTPKFQTSGESGELVGQIDEPGVYSFRSDSQSTEMVGTITVK